MLALLALAGPLASLSSPARSAGDTDARALPASEAAPIAAAAVREDRLLAAVPDGASILISIADLDGLRARADQSAWVRLARDERVAPFFERAGELLGRALEQRSGPAGKKDRTLDPAAWIGAVHGDAVGFFGLSEAARRPIGGLLVDDRDGALLELVEPSLAKLVANGWIESTESHAGVELRSFEEPVRSGASSRPRDRLVVFACEGALGAIIGDAQAQVLDLVHDSVDRLSGKSTSEGFAGNPWLAGLRKAVAHDHAIELYVDVAGMVEAGRAMASDEAVQGGEAPAPDAQTDKILRRIGVLDMRWVYAAADVGADEAFDLSVMAHLPAGSLLREAAGLFGDAPFEQLALAPPEALGAAAGRFDVNGLYQLVLGALRELAPDLHAQARMQIDQAKKGMGFDFERDLLAQITGSFASFTVRVPPSEGPAMAASMYGGTVPDALNQAGAFFVGLKDAAAVDRTVARLLQMGGLSEVIEPEQFQGRWTQSLSLPGQTLTWCFTSDQLVLAESRTALRAALGRLGQRGAPSLISDERYQQALQRHGGASVLTVADSKAAAATVLGSVQMILALAQMGAMSEGVDAPWLQQLGTVPPPNPAAAGRYLSGVLTSAVDVGPSFFKLHMSAR